ncbi:hypothetical protein KKF91_16685 [Myxococcota bacterium]|nr:hypothetical protein [Myxococcota bacterium]
MLNLLLGLLALSTSPAAELAAAHPGARLLTRLDARLLTGLRLPLAAGDPRQAVERLIQETPALRRHPLRFSRVTARRDRAVLHFDQLYAGRVVLDHGLTFTLIGGAVRVIQDRTAPLTHLRAARLSASDAEALAREALGGAARVGAAKPILLVDGEAAVEGFEVLAWSGLKAVSLRIDAAAGRVIGAREAVKR